LKLNKVGVVSKFGSKESEEAAKKVAKKLIAKKIEVFTIAPVSVPGAKKVETIEELKNKKLDLVITLGGMGLPYVPLDTLKMKLLYLELMLEVIGEFYQK